MNIKRSVSRASLKVKKSVRKQSADKTEPLRIPKPRQLLRWYDAHRRILPWRALPGLRADPYHVWLSEVMLQQTTVAAVGPYFQRFLKRWPTLHDLAESSIDEVRQMWAGLGYYRRAQSLHACARLISREFNGVFPDIESQLLELPGFGPYTAAAVASIAFDRKANVVDGNVERVMARVFAVESPLPGSKRIIRDLAFGLLPRSRHGDYAQALMDLGATICTPRNPECDLCPWATACEARARGLTDILPRKTKKTPKPVRQGIAFFITNGTGQVLLRKRAEQGLLSGMMEVPSTVWREGSELVLRSVLPPPQIGRDFKLIPGTVQHIFSHFELRLRIAVAIVSNVDSAEATAREFGGIWVAPGDLKSQALPSVMRKIVRHVFGLI